jgi:phosphate starvation-inducible PhoH-like protein
MQAEYLKALEEHEVVFSIGPAGTGKTYLAVTAAVNALRAKKVDRIILVRPAVEAGESLGFLPGDMQEKVDPYLRPMYDALADLMSYDKMRRSSARRDRIARSPSCAAAHAQLLRSSTAQNTVRR